MIRPTDVAPVHGVHPVFAFIGRDDAGLARYVHYGRVVARVRDLG